MPPQQAADGGVGCLLIMAWVRRATHNEGMALAQRTPILHCASAFQWENYFLRMVFQFYDDFTLKQSHIFRFEFDFYFTRFSTFQANPFTIFFSFFFEGIISLTFYPRFREFPGARSRSNPRKGHGSFFGRRFTDFV